MPPNQWETVFGPMWLVYWSGEPIQSKRVTRLISSSWLNAGLKSQISTTLLRKTIVSKVRKYLLMKIVNDILRVSVFVVSLLALTF